MSRVNQPYSLPEHQTKLRVFCSSKALPCTPDEEFKEYLGFLADHISHMHRPNPAKEFLYVEFKDPSAAHWLLSQHPLVLKSTRLNLSIANDKELPK